MRWRWPGWRRWSVWKEMPATPRLLAFAGWAFLAGIVLFCGALYLLAIQGPSPLGAVAPVGGMSFMAGWAALAAVGVRWMITDPR